MTSIRRRSLPIHVASLLAIVIVMGAQRGSAEILDPGSAFTFGQRLAGDDREEGDQFGRVVVAGDFNGDSFGDLAVASPGENGGSGSISIFHGAEEGITRGYSITQSHGGGTSQRGDRFGAAMVAGDFNTDGFEDLAVGAPGKDGESGTVYVFPGSLAGLAAGSVLGQDAAGETGAAGDHFGEALGAGDFNDDGFEDLVVGAPGKNGSAGAVFVFPTEEGVFIESFVVTQDDAGGAADPGDRFGAAVTVGDFTGEGFDELVAGAPGEDTGSGAVSIFYGAEDGITTGVPLSQSDAGETSETGDLFGAALVAGDHDADGNEELVVGAPGEDGGAGRVLVFPGAEEVGITEGFAISQSDAGGVAGASDGFGAALVTGGFNDDAAEDLAVGAPGAAGGEGRVFVFPGAEEEGISEGFVITQTDVGATAQTGDRFGASLASEDFDDDGGAELAVGAPGEDDAKGVVSVIPGVALSPQAVTRVHAGGVNEEEGRFGAATASGDFDADGFDDLAVGAPSGEDPPGTVSIFAGSEAEITAGFSVTHQHAGGGDWEEGEENEFGAALVVGDFDADGYDDLAVGAPEHDHGAVFLFPGSEAGITSGFLIDQRDAGEDESNARFGAALAAGDFDGDGFDDLAVGAPRSDRDEGALFVFSGSLAGLGGGFEVGDDDDVFDALRAGLEYLGAALAAGDFDGDGFADLAAGAPGDSSSQGAVVLLRGSAAGIGAGFVVKQSDAGEIDEDGDLFGAALGAGDFEGDGFADLVVGAPGEAPGTDPQSGLVFVFSGSDAGISTGFQLFQTDAAGEYVAGAGEFVELNEAGDEFGAAFAVGDWDDDGISDLAVGAPGEAPGPYPASGMVFFFRGTEEGIRTSFDPDEEVSDFNFFYTQTGFGGQNEAGDRFGASLVTGDWNGDAERGLAVGAPGEAHGLDPPESGAVNFIPAAEVVP